MSIQKLNPYLVFNGDAEKAIRLYERALGATTEGLMRFGEVPGSTIPSEHRNRVTHAQLHIGGGVVMVSDSMPGEPAPAGSNVQVALDFDDVEEMKQRFDALAADGKVQMPPQETFWGATFGMLTDAFGVGWMLNCYKKKG